MHMPRCSVSGFRQGVHTVSWTKTTSQSADPIALTFNDKVRLIMIDQERLQITFYVKK